MRRYPMTASVLIIAALVFVLVFLFGQARAAEFQDSGAFLDQRLHGFDQLLLEMDERLKVLEQGEPPPPVDPVDPDPPPVDPPPVDPPPPTDVACPVIEPDPAFKAHHIPGRIEAEDYDFGANGSAYMDTTAGNTGGTYREDDVDIKVSRDIDGGHQVGWISDGERLNYTVCADAGTYDIHVRTTKNTERAGSIDVLLDGQPLGRISVPFTGSWDADHTTQVIRNVTVTGGNRLLELGMVGGPFDVNWIKFVAAGTAINRAPTAIWLCPADPVELALGRVVADTSNDGEKCDKGNSG